MLTDAQIRARKARRAPARALRTGMVCYLQIDPSGGRYWRFNYRFNGKQKTLALGVYPDVSLAKARERLRKRASSSPTASILRSQEASVGKTFEVVAREWHARWSAHRHGRYAHYVLKRLEEDVFPSIGARLPPRFRPRPFGTS